MNTLRKTLGWILAILTIILLLNMAISCAPQYYHQAQNKIKLEVTYLDGLRDYFLVSMDYTFKCGCIVSEGKEIACNVTRYKEL